MSIKVCHITSVHKFPDIRIFYKECVSLSTKYEVHLITSNVKDCVKDGVTVHGVALPSNRLSRVMQLNRVYKKAVEINADIYHFHDPELMKMGVALKKKGKKVVFDSHEDIPLDIAEKTWMPYLVRKMMSKYYEVLEKKLLRKYDALVSVTPSIVDKLRKINPNTYQITNYPFKETFNDQRTWQNAICFAGVVNSSWMHEYIFEALRDLDVVYDLAGPSTQEYIDKIRSNEVSKKIVYHGNLKLDKVKPFIQKHIAGMALYDYKPSFGYKKGSLGNNKIFEYMAAGVPVIATDFELWREIIEKNECGICVNPHDVSSIESAIRFLLEHPEEAKRMGDNGVKITQNHYNWSSQEQILFDLYNSCLQ